MANSSPSTLSRHFTHLVGKQVSFTPAKSAPDFSVRQGYGVYTLYPSKTQTIVAADLELLGFFAGALMGLPGDEVKRHLQSSFLGEPLKDAMCEVLNVASAVIVESERAVFHTILTNPGEVHEPVRSLLENPVHTSYFTVTIEGYGGGNFSVLS